MGIDLSFVQTWKQISLSLDDVTHSFLKKITGKYITRKADWSLRIMCMCRTGCFIIFVPMSVDCNVDRYYETPCAIKKSFNRHV